MQNLKSPGWVFRASIATKYNGLRFKPRIIQVMTKAQFWDRLFYLRTCMFNEVISHRTVSRQANSWTPVPSQCGTFRTPEVHLGSTAIDPDKGPLMYYTVLTQLSNLSLSSEVKLVSLPHNGSIWLLDPQRQCLTNVGRSSFLPA